MKNKIPALRFPEFDGEWIYERLGNIAEIERGRFSPRPRNNPIYYGGSIPFVQTGDVVKSKGRISNYSQTLNEKGLKVSKKFIKGTILITIAANIGFTGILEIDMACPDSLVGISCHEFIFNYFLNYVFEINQRKMDYLAVEAAQKNINIEFLQIYPINFPPLPEQQKIADFLTTVDNKINQLTRKKTLLEQYKKGVMQKIFSQDIRFTDEEGNEFLQWEVKKLGEIGTFKNGLNKSNEDFGFGHPFVNLMDVFGKSSIISTDFGLVNSSKKELEEYNLKKGDVLFIRSSVKREGVGQASVLQTDLDGTVYSGFLIRFRTEINTIELLFKKYCFATKSFRNQVLAYCTTSANTNINQESLKKISLSVPFKEEQKKIADFLSGIDQKIELVNSQIEKTKEWKRGLLQQMFV